MKGTGQGFCSKAHSDTSNLKRVTSSFGGSIKGFDLLSTNTPTFKLYFLQETWDFIFKWAAAHKAAFFTLTDFPLEPA